VKSELRMNSKAVLNTLTVITLALFSPLATATESVQQAVCYPSNAEAKSWPVKAIYLHGLFKPSGSDTFGFQKLEASNRAKLEKMAKDLHFRIALPVAQKLSSKGFRQWQGTSLKQIEDAATKACGVTKLAPERALIGFSNGGYKVREISALPCSETTSYVKILAIGAPDHSHPGKCAGGNQLVNKTLHDLPDQMFFANQLSSLVEEPKDDETVKTHKTYELIQ
jgi:hypothetical protein